LKEGTMSRKFSLQTVLEYRKVLEDKARQRHARALVRVREIEEEILLAERSLSDLCRSMEDRCGTGWPGSAVKSLCMRPARPGFSKS
jgi:flagellar biosynthesis chaperone FliJ